MMLNLTILSLHMVNESSRPFTSVFQSVVQRESEIQHWTEKQAFATLIEDENRTDPSGASPKLFTEAVVVQPYKKSIL